MFESPSLSLTTFTLDLKGLTALSLKSEHTDSQILQPVHLSGKATSLLIAAT
jgi:hypothetical protein